MQCMQCGIKHFALYGISQLYSAHLSYCDNALCKFKFYFYVLCRIVCMQYGLLLQMSMCLCVCLLSTRVSYAKTAEPIEMPFGS